MEIGKILFIYLCIALCLSIFFPKEIYGEETILSIFNVKYNETSNEVEIKEGFSNDDINTLTDNEESKPGLWQTISGAVSDFYKDFVDGLKNVLGVLKIFFKFLFSPIIFVTSPAILGEAPFYIKILFAIPLIFLALTGFIRFIRSGV